MDGEKWVADEEREAQNSVAVSENRGITERGGNTTPAKINSRPPAGRKVNWKRCPPVQTFKSLHHTVRTHVSMMLSLMNAGRKTYIL